MKSTLLKSLRKAPLPALALTSWALNSCAPLLDPNHPDQAPDLNYNATALKDAKFVGTINSIDAIVAERIGTRFPGAAVAVICGDQIVYMKGYGLADADAHIPFTKNTVAGIGSVSKVLTAIGVMKLVELGEVDLDETIDTYFSHAVPAGWNQVTVRQLLSHEGGFGNTSDISFTGPGTISPAGIDLSFGEDHSSQHPRYAIWEFLNSAMGTPGNTGTGSYSNPGYTILGAIIDNVTQANRFGQFKGYERFVWSLVAGADDAALTAAQRHPWRSDTGDIPNLAKSYANDWTEVAQDYSGWQGPAGGWSMTIGDLGRIAIALQENQILQPASLATMRVNHSAVQGSPYGLGLFLNTQANRTAYSHGGVIDGFRTQFTVWPNHDVAVVAFVNRDASGVNAIVNEIGDLWITYKETVQVAHVVFNEEDRRQMNTAAFDVSRKHYDEAERMVQAVIRGEEHDYDAVVRRFEAELGRQGVGGLALLAQVQRDSSDAEGAAQEFVSLLESDGHAGEFKPSLKVSTLADDLKGRWAYAENGGWINGNWDPEAPGGGKGVKVSEFILAGEAYAGNLGWLQVGDGTPADGIRYSNENDDYGVNLDLASGALRGYAYGSNIGWVKFESRGKPRIDLATGCFLGHAYSANCGWINLAPRHGSIGWKTVALGSGPDSDGDGLPDPWELEHAGDLTTLSGWADSDLDGQTDEEEYGAGTDPTDPDSFLKLWVNRSASGHAVSWTSESGRLYSLFETENLEDWSPMEEVTSLPGEEGTMGVDVSLGAQAQTFWKVEAKLPFGP